MKMPVCPLVIGPHGAALPAFCRRALAQRRQGHAHVRQRGRDRVPAPALARNGRQAVCPGCGCAICYACRRDFSITSGTLFAWHKLREAMASSVKGLQIGGEGRVAEIDGAYFGGEETAVPAIRQRIAHGTVVHADESPAWNPLHARFAMQRINHQDGYSVDGACTNGAESYFSRLRRGELGHHHHIAGPYLVRYAQEAASPEDLRRVSNGEQAHGIVGLAMRSSPSVDFCGYWQRAQAR